MAVVIAGSSPASAELAQSIADAAGIRIVDLDWKRFPDGEHYVRVRGDIRGEDVFVVQTMSPPQNDSLVQALLLADAAIGMGAERVRLIAPYLAYSRQDRRFLEGEPVSVEVVLKSLRCAGYDWLLTVEVHKEESLKAFDGEAYNLSPYEYMAGRINVGGDILVLAPDVGALDRARRLASALDAEYDYLVKHRDRITGEIVVEPKEIPARGKTVVLVDDIISTGGTLAKAASMLLNQGAERIYALVAHALMVGGALEKLSRAGITKIYAANTLPAKRHEIIEYVDIGPLIAESLPV